MAQVTIEVEKIDTLRADDRGRVALGSDYAGKNVEVAVIEATERCRGDMNDMAFGEGDWTTIDDVSDTAIRFIIQRCRDHGSHNHYDPNTLREAILDRFNIDPDRGDWSRVEDLTGVHPSTPVEDV
ncbi:hypothetical protein [Halalkalicoccus paucihalophilus]|uniref:hypothetical protein n=1 Tax=Halalkalicoccus paucihalophilus TaxID=1008153 RepID=UPI0012ED1D11|nr:hypothetical protein [Halalkalicoccus paucihalophilus]